MIRYPSCSLVVAVLAATATAAEIDSASLQVDASYGHSPELGSSMQGVVEALGSIEASWNDSATFVASARVRADFDDELEPGRVPRDTYATGSRPLELGTTGSVELRDFYLEWRLTNGLLRVGKQSTVWGRLDGIKVLDVANPQDFREFILDDFADSRIGLWSAYLDLSLGNWRTELALIADGTGHSIPNSGAWFELTAPRFRYGAQPDATGLPVVTRSPGHSIDESAAGIRLSRQFGTAELAVVAYTGNDPEPLGRIITLDGEPAVERFYERRDVLGFSADVGLGSVVLRGEYAYQPDRTFNTRTTVALDTAELDQHRAAIGLDLAGPLEILINAQYLFDTVEDAPADLIRPASDRIGTLYLRRSFRYDSIIVSARWYHSFTDDDRLVAALVEYAFSDSTSLSASAEFFSGTPAGLFGQFRDRDRYVLTLRHTF